MHVRIVLSIDRALEDEFLEYIYDYIQVQRPQCQMGNSCSSGPQICCRTEYQNVCENKIQKVPRTMQVGLHTKKNIKKHAKKFRLLVRKLELHHVLSLLEK